MGVVHVIPAPKESNGGGTRRCSVASSSSFFLCYGLRTACFCASPPLTREVGASLGNRYPSCFVHVLPGFSSSFSRPISRRIQRPSFPFFTPCDDEWPANTAAVWTAPHRPNQATVNFSDEQARRVCQNNSVVTLPYQPSPVPQYTGTSTVLLLSAIPRTAR